MQFVDAVLAENIEQLRFLLYSLVYKACQLLRCWEIPCHLPKAGTVLDGLKTTFKICEVPNQQSPLKFASDKEIHFLT